MRTKQVEELNCQTGSAGDPPELSPIGPGKGAVAAGLSEEAALLSMIADMAAGAAHELNNPLTVISGRAQLMQEKARDEKQRQVWKLIAEQSQRISDIITDLMQFASPSISQPDRVNMGILLKNLISKFSSPNTLNAKATQFDKEVEDQLPDIWADRAQVQAVAEELVQNAINAAKATPYILLSAGAASGGKQVLLTVRDNGPGMDCKTLAKAFTPFFSSHPAGRRRGLGLPLAWRYVVGNHGRIWLESQPGKGTSAFVLLPAAK